MNSSMLYTGIAVAVAVVVVIVAFFFPNYLSGFSTSQNPTSADSAINLTSQSGNTTSPDATAPATTATVPTANPNAVAIQDVVVGTGAVAQPGDQVIVQYTGKLADGTVFDASSQHTEVMQGCAKAGEFCFTLGAGQVIPGWDRGLVGMKVGGERTLVIPPSLAYGSEANGPIPANSTLTFDVKLLGVTPGSSAASAQ